MLNAIKSMIKILFFSIIVLVIGNWIHWNGRTVSDQIKVQMSNAERSDVFHRFQSWSKTLADDAKKRIHPQNKSNLKSSDSLNIDEIPPTEREKLRALIRDLNHAQHDN